MVTLDIIIVNWNTGEQLRACLASIAAAGREGFELQRVCVVDNASTDGSADGHGDIDIPLVLVRNTVNRGFAAACNQGTAGSGADYLLFLNPDTKLLHDSLSVPLAFMEREGNEKIGVVGIRLVGDDGVPHRASAQFPAARHFLSRIFGLDVLFPRLLPSYRLLDWDHAENRIVDQVTGAFFMVRRNLFEALGGFDERYFVYMEELDFSRRMSDAGWKSFYLADVAAYHKGGGASETDRGRRLFYMLRSRMVYAFTHFGRPAAVALALCSLLFEPVIRIASALLRGSVVGARETARGSGLLWRELPRILRGKSVGDRRRG
jgi:N-acetylglucosaminyl-diphospho-decaprenol L-rhamnosyltransferase